MQRVERGGKKAVQNGGAAAVKKIPFITKFVGAASALGAIHSYLVVQSMRQDATLAPHLDSWYRNFRSFALVGIFFTGPLFGLVGAIWCYFKADKWRKPPWLTTRRLILAVALLFAWNLAFAVLTGPAEPPISSIQYHSARAFMNPILFVPQLILIAIALEWSLNPESNPVSEMERLAVLGMSLGGIAGLLLMALRRL